MKPKTTAHRPAPVSEVLSDRIGSFRNAAASQLAIHRTGIIHSPRASGDRVWLHHFGEGFITTPDDFVINPPAEPSGAARLPRQPIHGRRGRWRNYTANRALLHLPEAARTTRATRRRIPTTGCSGAHVRRLEFEPRDSILYIGSKLTTLGASRRPVRARKSRRRGRPRSIALATTDCPPRHAAPSTVTSTAPIWSRS